MSIVLKRRKSVGIKKLLDISENSSAKEVVKELSTSGFISLMDIRSAPAALRAE
jgi:hypothetical protein